jgi:cell wall-associated NlpC family hydrolase
LFFASANKNYASNFLNQPKDSVKIDSLVAYCKLQLGTKYKYSSCSPQSGFDCSGFVYYIYQHFKVKVPRASIDFGAIKTNISVDSCKIGDVIIFTGTNSKNRNPGHVGIIISNPGEELTFIHSSSNKKKSGVKISTYKESPYYEKRFLKIVRIAIIYK